MEWDGYLMTVTVSTCMWRYRVYQKSHSFSQKISLHGLYRTDKFTWSCDHDLSMTKKHQPSFQNCNWWCVSLYLLNHIIVRLAKYFWFLSCKPYKKKKKKNLKWVYVLFTLNKDVHGWITVTNRKLLFESRHMLNIFHRST